MITRFATILIALFLAGCQTTQGPTSIPGGESRVFEAPKCEVLGKTQYDQNWIDSQIEGGVAAFNWARPQDRTACPGTGEVKKAAPPPAKRRGIIGRIKDRIHPKKDTWPAAAAPVVPTPAPPAVTAAPAPVAAPTKPRDPVDDLLDTSALSPIRKVH